MRRFLLAERLLHDQQRDFSIELGQLMIQKSGLSSKQLLSTGEVMSTLPFGKIITLHGHTYYIHFMPPHPHNLFDKNAFRVPPPDKFDLFTFKPLHQLEMVGLSSSVLEDIQPHTMMMFWIFLISVDTLILFFFAFLLRKLLPLRQLKNAIMAYRDGDTNLNIPIKGEDEISQITYEFNRTLGKIASMREARSLFLRNILHELKTPIMKGSLTTDCLEISNDQERLKRIFARMDYLLGEFAKMERFSSGEWKLNLQEYRFVDLLDHACDLLLCHKDILCIEGEDSDLIINVDFELFAVALKNIIDNALKYSTNNPIIVISSHAIKVCSIGMPLSADKQNFTKPFNRPYEDSSSGLGLGLYITHSIIHKHNFNFLYHHINGNNCFTIIIK